MAKVDFAMVGIVSKCSPSLFSLLDKNIAIARSCDSTSNIPCNAREGKATNPQIVIIKNNCNILPLRFALFLLNHSPHRGLDNFSHAS